MDIDPFEGRLKFLALLQSMNASQQSLQRVSSFALRYHTLCQDLYSCILEELQQSSSMNARMNILYLIDTIIENSSALSPSQRILASSYVSFILKDLAKIIFLVAPPGPQGVPNLAAAKRLLEQWKLKNAFDDTPAVDDALHLLMDGREEEVAQSLNAEALKLQPTDAVGENPSTTRPSSTKQDVTFSRQDVLRRMDEDRERHKRSREQLWHTPTLGEVDPIDIEFDRIWETTSDLNDDDYEIMLEECKKQWADYPWKSTPTRGAFVR